MADRKGSCRIYASSGICRFGNRCKFLHILTGQTPSAASPSNANNQPRPNHPNPHLRGPTSTSRGTSISQTPRNVCHVFWETGTCNRSFDCSFRHVKDSVAAASTLATSEQTHHGEEPEFFSNEGLVVHGGATANKRAALDPAEAHNNIQPFLRNNFHFVNASNVQGFVAVLESVHDSNKAWTSDTAQAFLETIVKGNGIIRMGDVLRFRPVSTNAGQGILSYQRGYFPIFEFMTSDLILKSTLHKNINHLYTLVENNYDEIQEVVNECMKRMISASSWTDPGAYNPQNGLTGIVVFRTLSTLYIKYFHLFKNAIKDHPQFADAVTNLQHWFQTWSSGVNTSPPHFDDPIVHIDRKARNLMIGQIRGDIEKLDSIMSRESGRAQRLKVDSLSHSGMTQAQYRQARSDQLAQTYVPPGELREKGPRHDNDCAKIAAIRVAPTEEELLCDDTYLPIFLPEAPHHLAKSSMERHLDIQFRLLREELVAPIRSSISAVYSDMWDSLQAKQRQVSQPKTQLVKLLKQRGGAYKTSGFDSVFFHVYTNVRFSPMNAERRDLTVGLSLDPPAGVAQDKDVKKRCAYWEHSKRLQSGSLVVLMMATVDGVRIFLGVVTSYSKDIAESAKVMKDAIEIQVSFFDPEVELMALRQEKASSNTWSYAILLDNSVMYEASRPFLEQLQSVEPTDIPFSRYIARHDSIADVQILPPKYATAPGFKFNLQCLAKSSAHRVDALNISQPKALDNARRQLRLGSSLDPSQLDAVLNTLVREVSLIQGPPGTGKSYTGREILKVLFASKVKPIVLIAYTNHALDHMLTEILDSNITTRLVRLGSRSSNERIAQYTLDKLEKLETKSNLDRSIGRQYAVMKELQDQMSQVVQDIQLPVLEWNVLQRHLQIYSPIHAESFENPPFWVQELFKHKQEDAAKHGEWHVKGKERADKGAERLSGTLYEFWKEGEDIKFITPLVLPAPKTKRGKKRGVSVLPAPQLDQAVIDFFRELGFGSQVPAAPNLSRSMPLLHKTSNIWSMSTDERQRLAVEWEQAIRQQAYLTHLERYKRLRTEYQEARKHFNDIRDETRRRLLMQTDLIACTTTGAAKLTSLLTSVSPRVLMVEEAGQVLEAHILTSLVSSVHHLICIGDPQQLRPNLATYGLSMDSEKGKQYYKFDRSLMERLADSNMPMTQINVQRRMRPAISHFIRTILYPKLEDNELVHRYPHVQGVQKDVYFLNHTHAENGTEDSVSKYNEYEVLMIRDLVLYFLRQGVYDGEGDIAVLCAYLGQLQKVREALRDLKIAVSVDERDEDQLVRQGLGDEGIAFQEVVVAKHIRLGTVDIFQGQEAKIVIVSLVRNTGTYETQSASIGFLKSSNRINVALSRAKHGLYILGNASNLRKSSTWSVIIDELETHDQIGPALPIVCPRHPDQAQLISNPGELSRMAPAGGCLLSCASRMPCGHICPSICHDARDNHNSIFCHMPCTKTPCLRNHPCSRRCSDDCGDCEFPMYNVRLPCGHQEAVVPCHLYDRREKVKCRKEVKKKLPRCEHSGIMPCSKDPALFTCTELCGGTMECCTSLCKSRCSECQAVSRDAKDQLNKAFVKRSKHKTHPCERPLYCQHECGKACHPKDQGCNSSCKKQCRQRCDHQKCQMPCSTPCAPCMEPCTWQCAHRSCPVSCGSICARLPCDEACTKSLECGHSCPSVCGEPCTMQSCIICLPKDRQRDIADLIMQRTLGEIDLSSHDVSDRLITLECGHIFTVETLDGHCGMSEYYEIDMMGQFVGLKAPPVEYKLPPVCPTCRGPISAPRYGRVVKRAVLDILEQNVASTMSRALEALNPGLENIAAELPALQDSAKKMAGEFDGDKEVPDLNVRMEKASGTSAEPLSPAHLDQHAMCTLHGLSTQEGSNWKTIVKELLSLYRRAHAIAVKRGAHIQAYEAAVTTLYRLGLDAIRTNADVTANLEAPEQQAIEAARRDIGQPPHKADSKFQVEAYFRTLELRFMLAQIAHSRVESLKIPTADDGANEHRERWISLVDFIYKSCEEDAKKALAMAERSSASRQAAHCAVYGIRCGFERLRFESMTREGRLASASTPEGRTARTALVNAIQSRREEIEHEVQLLERNYVKSRPARTIQDLTAERQWFEDNCKRKINRFLKELEDLAEYVRKGGSYEPLSMQEMQDIVKAFDFGYTGHFYRCPNGHPYVIGECGGAMATARCNECGELIGGGSHALLNTNTVAREFEEILRDRGARQGFY